ncbi:MAG: DPP IV N-terminal domain-containing protein, partial [Pseudomonadota bacterium]
MTDPAPDMATIPLERMFASPSLSGPSPREVKYSPDGQRVSFLKARVDDAARFDLWAFDVATGDASMLVDSKLLEPDEVELSEEEKAIRERKRIAGSKGIVSYDWGGSDQILVPLGGDLHLVTLTETGPTTRQLTETDAFEYDARVSPAGTYVSFVRDGAVYAINLESGEETRMTPLAEPENAISYGVAEFVAQEEMSRYTGYWWSPDDTYLAYTRVDESTVDIIPRFEIAAGETTVIEQRYPRAGRPNAVVDLFVRDIEAEEINGINWRMTGWGPATDQYLARVNWNTTSESTPVLTVQRVNRDQTHLTTGQYDPRDTNWSPSEEPGVSANAEIGTLLEEVQLNWINLSFDLKQCGDRRVFTSEESGHRHVLIDRRPIGARGYRDREPEQVTAGSWDVAEIVTCSEPNSEIFFTGFKDTPL